MEKVFTCARIVFLRLRDVGCNASEYSFHRGGGSELAFDGIHGRSGGEDAEFGSSRDERRCPHARGGDDVDLHGEPG